MKKFLSLLLIGFLVPQLACGALPLKVDGLKSNGDVAITGSSQTSGSVAIGTASAADSKAALDVVSTTKGFLPPRMTTTQRDAISSPPAGLTVYNTTTNKLNQFNGTAWGEVAGSGSSGAQYNTLANYNFEDTTYSTGWTASGGTLAAAAGTNILFGTQSATWDSSSAGQTLSYTAITIGQGYKGNNCEGAIYVQTPSGTATHLLEVYDGTNVLVSGTVITSTTARQTTVNFPCPSSGTMQLRLKSVASDEPLIAVDDAYLGLARNVGVAQLIATMPTTTLTVGAVTSGPTKGAITLDTVRTTRVGADAIIEIDYLQSTSGAAAGTGVYLFTLPNSMIADETKVSHSVTITSDQGDAGGYIGSGSIQRSGAHGGSVSAYLYDTTRFYLKFTGGLQDNTGTTVSADAGNAFSSSTVVTFAHNLQITLKLRVPIKGWTAQTTASIDAISKRGSAYFATGNATTTSGSAVAFNNASFSSPTLEGQALAPTTANDVGIRLANAPAGVYEVNAVGWFYAYRASGETGTNCAYDLYDGTSSRSATVAGAPNVAGVSTLDGIGSLSGTFTLSSAGTINVVLRGQRTSGTGACYVDGPISISIKNVSQPSPAIVFANGVSTSATNGLKIESFSFTCSGSSSIAVQLGGTSWVSSIGNIAAGVCAVGISAGTFSGSPQCQVTWTGGGSNAVVYSYAETSSGFNVGAVTDTGAAATSFTGKAMCVGPR